MDADLYRSRDKTTKKWQADDDVDVAVLENWMKEYGTDVMNLAFAYVRNYHQAQDITQDVFIRAFTNMRSFRGDSKVKTWLLSITANRCRDYLRSWQAKHVFSATDEYEAYPATVQLEEEVTERLARDELWQVIHQLPVKYREVLILYYQRELSTQEVAQVLGVTDQSVRTRLHRARVLLREQMDRQGGHYGKT